MRQNEKAFIQATPCKRTLCHKEFKVAQHNFDKLLRYHSRKYQRGKALTIEKCCTDNPKEFWKHIKQLGPKCSKTIPLTVQTETETITEVNDVLVRWQNDLYKLYNNCDTSMLSQNFYNDIVQQVVDYEDNVTFTNDYVNQGISYDEVEKSCNKAKNG